MHEGRIPKKIEHERMNVEVGSLGRVTPRNKRERNKYLHARGSSINESLRGSKTDAGRRATSEWLPDPQNRIVDSDVHASNQPLHGRFTSTGRHFAYVQGGRRWSKTGCGIRGY